ncbi:DUF2326 domain-containing protein [Pseudovibrio sp. WM33]|uniref:DUF2326 domain-containing protein n=1 Tax=Pseudovibrio sp. WM33 TaxID=1735585 RepID=UPI001FCAF1AC
MGDAEATNSIGKSTLLMIVDFVFGGNDLLKLNTDIITELGDHSYQFCFEFDHKKYFFSRHTNKSKTVYVCDKYYNELYAISLEEYTHKLKKLYKIPNECLTFRSIVSLFARIWQRENLDVSRPLHLSPARKSIECVDFALKIFNTFDGIAQLSEKLKILKDEKSQIKSAFDASIVPKITKTKYNQNSAELTDITSKMDHIQENLEKYAINVNSLLSEKTVELKEAKDHLLNELERQSVRLKRIDRDLSQNRHLASISFEPVVELFPEINVKKLQKIEQFHFQISEILSDDLSNERSELLEATEVLKDELQEINEEIEKQIRLEKHAAPKPIAEAIFSRALELFKKDQKLQSENSFYERNSFINEQIKRTKKDYTDEKSYSLELVEAAINTCIDTLVDTIYGPKRQRPFLDLSESKYSYATVEDTGTGKAYMNLVLFDLAMFKLTNLPLLIHDSLLFKNIENNGVSGVIPFYEDDEKQSFVSIDEIEKYGQATEKKLLENCILKLSNASVLFTRDWRKS